MGVLIFFFKTVGARVLSARVYFNIRAGVLRFGGIDASLRLRLSSNSKGIGSAEKL